MTISFFFPMLMKIIALQYVIVTKTSLFRQKPLGSLENIGKAEPYWFTDI